MKESTDNAQQNNGYQQKRGGRTNQSLCAPIANNTSSGATSADVLHGAALRTRQNAHQTGAPTLASHESSKSTREQTTTSRLHPVEKKHTLSVQIMNLAVEDQRHVYITLRELTSCETCCDFGLSQLQPQSPVTIHKTVC